jgi:hypothetical protein
MRTRASIQLARFLPRNTVRRDDGLHDLPSGSETAAKQHRNKMARAREAREGKMSFVEFMRKQVGANWVLCRRTKKNLERYENSTILSRKQYNNLVAQYCQQQNTRLAWQSLK